MTSLRHKLKSFLRFLFLNKFNAPKCKKARHNTIFSNRCNRLCLTVYKKGTYAFISDNYAVQFGSRYSNNKTRNANCYTMQLLLR